MNQAPPRRRRWILWAVLIGGGFLLVIMMAGAVAAAFLSRPEVKRGSVVVVRFEGDIEEAPAEGPFSFLATSGGSFVTLYELRRLVDAAVKDDRVAGVLLEVGSISSGFGSVEEARSLIGKLREAKKPVQAVLVGDFIEEKDYLLATAADRVIVVPESGLLLNGLDAEVIFWRGTFDKLHIEPQFFMFKEYKSAAEPLVNRQMSKPMRESLESILDDYYTRFLQVVAERRGLSAEALRSLFDRGGLTPSEGLEAKLVDKLGYPDDVEEELKGAAGLDTQKSARVSAKRYLASTDEPREGDEIALIYGIGEISASAKSQASPLSGSAGILGPRLAKTIHEAADDSKVKAIILRVNSPGGSAVGSDFVWRAVQAARKKKPVVVSMGDVAGSGGYWISMGADAIVAEPSTLTGSIGLIFGKFNVRGLLGWAGANVDGVKIGKNADLMSPFHSFDPQQTELVKTWMSAVYNDFVRRVAEGRGLTPAEVEPVAHGRVWTGFQAKERKLVDALGGLDSALTIAREKANIPKGAPVYLRRFPQKKGILEALSEGEFPLLRVLLGEQSWERTLRESLAEWETMRPWAIAPEIRVH